MKWIVKDLKGNKMFDGQIFDSFDEAHEALEDFLGGWKSWRYDDEFDNYTVQDVEENQGE
jgi:hypothetical protein